MNDRTPEALDALQERLAAPMPMSSFATQRDLYAELCSHRLEAHTAITALRAERDALRERVAQLEAALTLYSCEDGCNDCPEHERDRVNCGWTAFAALQKDTPND